jgi:hypothetical protein
MGRPCVAPAARLYYIGCYDLVRTQRIAPSDLSWVFSFIFLALGKIIVNNYENILVFTCITRK